METRTAVANITAVTSVEEFVRSSEFDSRGGGGTSLLGLYGDVPLDRVWFFGLVVLSGVYNLTCFCPKQGILFRAETETLIQTASSLTAFFS